MADPSAIQWDDDTPADGGAIAWDDEHPDFGNVQAGRATTAPNAQSFGPVNVSRGTLPQLDDWDLSPEGMAIHPAAADAVAKGASDIAGELESGAKGIAEDYQYADDGRRVVGVPEGFARRVGEGLSDMSRLAGYLDPDPIGGAIIRQGAGETAAQLAINPEKERFAGARAEAVSTGGADLLTNFLPIERAGAVAAKLWKAPWLKTGAKDAAIVGDLGPGPQGAATADEIVDQAIEGAAKAPTSASGKINITPEMREPAEAVPDVRSGPGAFPGERADVVPDATLDASTGTGEGPAAGLPAGDVSGAPAAREARSATGAPVEAGPVRTPEEPPAEMTPSAATGDITADFTKKLEDHPAAVAEYDANPDTEGGIVLNTDTARELSPDYLRDRTQSAAVHEPASAFVKRRYAEKLAEPTPEGMEREVLFTAGGTGAGKSTGRAALTESGALGRPEIVYDTNMNTYDSARQKIEQALESGRKVKILYTYRDPVESLRSGALPRAMRQEGEFGSGRTVPLDEHLKTHLGAYDTVQQIARDFHANPDVEVYAIDNSRGRGNARPVALSEVPNPHRENLKNALRSSLEEARASGEISEPVYQGFLRDSRAESARPGAGGSVREEPQPASPRSASDEVGVRASIRDQEPTNAEAVRSDQGQVRGAGRVGGGGENARGENLQRIPEKERSPFAQRVHEAGAGEKPGNAAAGGGLKEPGKTGIYNAKVAEERARRGLEEVKHDLSRTDPEGWESARQRLEDDPNYGRSLASELVQKARPATKEEVFALIQDRQRIKNERRATYERAELATDAGETDKALQERARIAELDNEMEVNDVASRYAGHESAEGLRARQRMSREDYSMAELVQRAKVGKGGKLTDEEVKLLEAQARDVEKREAAVAAREQAIRDARARPKSPFGVKDAGKRFDSLVDELKKIADKDQLTPGCIV